MLEKKFKSAKISESFITISVLSNSGKDNHELHVHPLHQGGKMLEDSEGFKYYKKNGLYVCVDYKKTKSSCPTTLTYNETTQHRLPKYLATTTMMAQSTSRWR